MKHLVEECLLSAMYQETIQNIIHATSCRLQYKHVNCWNDSMFVLYLFRGGMVLSSIKLANISIKNVH